MPLANNGKPPKPPDLEEAQRFLELLGATQCTFQTFDDNAGRKNQKLVRVLHGDLAEHADELTNLNYWGAGVFVALNQTDGEGRKRENIISIRAVAADLDGSPLDPVRQCALKPHIIVESSPDRYHVYWRVKGLTVGQFEDVQRAIARRFDADPQIAKLTHVARLPGFYHVKSVPFCTRIVEANNLPPYSANEIVKEFPPLDMPHKPPSSLAGVLVLSINSPLKSAQEFVRRIFEHNGASCLVHYRGVFYEWTGTHYRGCDTDHLRSKLYKFLEMARTPRDKTYEPFNPTAHKVNQVLDALRSLVGKDPTCNAPFWTSQVAPADPGNLIACQNGLLNIETRELLPHSPHFFNVNCLPFDYDPSAPCPKLWLTFQHQLWPNDEDGQSTLQEIFGLMLTADTRYQKIFMIVGPKRSGKGTIGRVLTALLGKENVVNPTLASLNTNFGLSPLIDKRVAIIPDARLAPHTNAHTVERLLSISGEDALTVDRKYRDPWNGRLGIRFLILTNELPRMADSSGAATFIL
jgi:hypothetical protein